MKVYVPKEGSRTCSLHLGRNKNSLNNKCYLPSALDCSEYVFASEIFYKISQNDFLSAYGSKERIYYICAKDWNDFFLYDIEGNIVLDKWALICYVADHYFVCCSTSTEETYKDDDGYIDYYLKSASLPQIYYKDVFLGEGEYMCNSGLMYIRQGDKWRVYDKSSFLFLIDESELGTTLYTEKGNCLINKSFKEIKYEGDLIIVNDDNGWSIYSLTGCKLIEDSFEEVQIQENFIIAKNIQGWGVWCLDGSNILPAMHDSVSILPEVIIYQVDGKDGMISRDGKCILTPKYKYKGICKQTYNSDDDYDYYPFPEKAVFYTLPGYDSESKSACQCLNEYELLIQNGDLDKDEVIIKNGVEHASYLPEVKDAIYLFLDGEQTLIVTAKSGIICRIPYVAKNRISDELILVEHNNKLGVYSIRCKSLIIDHNYDRIQFDGNVFLCYHYIDNPEINEEKNPIGKNDITIFQFDESRNSCSRISGYDICKVFNIGYNLYVFVKSFTECELHYIGKEHIEYKSLFDAIRYINAQRWTLHRPPYFINKNTLCVPLSYSYTDEVDLPYYNDQIKMKSIVEEMMSAVSEKVSEKIEQGIFISVRNDEYRQDVYTHIIKYALCEYNDVTKELKFKVLPKYDEICPRNDGNYDVRIGKAWGIVSPTGIEISRIKYKDKVTSSYVEDAYTGSVGFLSNDFSTEVLPTIYHRLWFENDIPLAASMVVSFEQDYENSYWNSPALKVRDLFALLKEGKTVITPHIYSDLKIHEGFVLAKTGWGKFEVPYSPQCREIHIPYCPELHVYSLLDMERVYSANDVEVYCTKNLPLIKIGKSLKNENYPNNKKYYYHSLSEGWDTEMYVFIQPVNSSIFIVSDNVKSNYQNPLYGIKNHKGEGTEREFMFVTKPINGCCFAAKENSNTSDEEKKSYSVYLFKSKDEDAIEKIPVIENISMEMLYELVESDCLYLCSLKYCIDKKWNKLITQEFCMWANESVSDFENAKSTKDRDGIYWLRSEITTMYTDRHYHDYYGYPDPSSAFEGDGGLYRDWRLG